MNYLSFYFLKFLKIKYFSHSTELTKLQKLVKKPKRMPNVNESMELFDSKPLQKKHQKHTRERQIQTRLEHAISDCLSSYMISHFDESTQDNYGRKQCQTKRQATQKEPWDKSCILKDAYGSKKDEIDQKIQQMTQNVKQNIYEFVCSILQVFKSNKTNQQIKSGQIREQSQQLTQSNRNFLVQLFTDFGLLKYYKGVNRTFKRLVEQAQNAYYNLHNLIQSARQSLGSMERSNHSKCELFNKSQSLDEMETVTTFLEMKKRLLQAKSGNHVMQRTLQSAQKVYGYDLEESMHEFKTQRGQQNTYSFQRSSQSPLASCFYFTDVQNNTNFQQKQLQQSALLSPDQKVHKDFIKIVSEWNNGFKPNS